LLITAQVAHPPRTVRAPIKSGGQRDFGYMRV
jgi:hypothetical protein